MLAGFSKTAMPKFRLDTSLVVTMTVYMKFHCELVKGMFKLFSKNVRITLTVYFIYTILIIIHPISQMQMM